jgi:hypothetical protein
MIPPFRVYVLASFLLRAWPSEDYIAAIGQILPGIYHFFRGDKKARHLGRALLNQIVFRQVLPLRV